MSDLFSEALKDSQKLREIAEQDAKNAIVEAITPYIREMIAKEVANPTDFFFEQDEEPETLEQPVADVQGMGGATPTVQPATTVDPTTANNLGPDLGNTATAPLTPEGEKVVNATMPDEDGKITVDFQDLFIDDGKLTLAKDQLSKLAPVQAKGEEMALEPTVEPGMAPTAAQPAVAAPETAAPDASLQLPTESLSYKEYGIAFSNIAERIDRAFFAGKITDVGRETLKQRIFDLLEAVDLMKEKGLITAKQARLQENKLEFLFIKLKEAGLRNSYSMKNNEDKDTTMKSLKEFAAKLFEEEQNLAQDSASTGETGNKVDDAASKHAADVSGVDPKLGGRKDIEVAGKSLTEGDALPGSDDPDEEPWEKGEPVVAEEDQAGSMNEASGPDAKPGAHKEVSPAAMGFGDTDEEPETAGLAAESVEYEIDSDELAEAIRDIRKEGIRDKMRKLAEASDGKDAESWEDAEPEGGKDESQKNLKEGTMDETCMEDVDGMPAADDEDEGLVDDGGVADLVLSIDLPPEVEEELAQLGLTDDDLDVDVELNVGDLDGMDDDAEVEIVDDDEDMNGPGSEEQDMLMADEMAEGMMEGKKNHMDRKHKLLEKKLLRAAKLLEEKNKELTELKKQLVETNLFTAKAVYYSKFLQRALTEKALTKKALQQIVEHLDKGKTVAETKAIYKKIETKLNEHVTASRKLDGSSSKVTKPGSANLTEGVAPQAGHEILDGQTSDRWKQLAGIRRAENKSS